MCLLCEHRKTGYDPQWLTQDKRDAKKPNQCPHLLQVTSWRNTVCNLQTRVGIRWGVPMPPLFWLVDILLKLASFITPSFIASAGDPQAYKAISSPSLVTNLRTGNIYPALLSCDTNNQVCCLSKNSANIKSLFLMWHWLNLFLKNECIGALSQALWPFQRTKNTFNVQVFRSHGLQTSVLNITRPEGSKLNL